MSQRLHKVVDSQIAELFAKEWSIFRISQQFATRVGIHDALTYWLNRIRAVAEKFGTIIAYFWVERRKVGFPALMA